MEKGKEKLRKSRSFTSLGEYYSAQTKHVILKSSSSPYGRWHELSHSIQDRNQTKIWKVRKVWLEVKLFMPNSRVVNRIWDWIKLFAEIEAMEIAKKSLEYLNKWKEDEAEEALVSLRTYACTQRMAEVIKLRNWDPLQVKWKNLDKRKFKSPKMVNGILKRIIETKS